jgi:hypothetical protein
MSGRTVENPTDLAKHIATLLVDTLVCCAGHSDPELELDAKADAIIAHGPVITIVERDGTCHVVEVHTIRPTV